VTSFTRLQSQMTLKLEKKIEKS